MDVVAFIFARGGSKGLPGKNIRPLAGKPLIAWAIEQARAVSSIRRIIVSTDSNEIASIATEYGAEVPFMRPKNLAKDTTGMAEVMIHAITKLQSMKYEFDIFVNRDCTVPFIRN